MKREVVSYEAVEFFIKPGDVVDLNDKKDGLGQLNAYVATSWPTSMTPKQLHHEVSDQLWSRKSEDDKKKYEWKWKLECWRYRYDGSLYERKKNIVIEMGVDDLNEEAKIQELNVYPFQYASK